MKLVFKRLFRQCLWKGRSFFLAHPGLKESGLSDQGVQGAAVLVRRQDDSGGQTGDMVWLQTWLEMGNAEAKGLKA